MILLQQPVLEQAIAEVRAAHYVEAWMLAGSDARARTYVRYHAGDLDGALGEARAGLRSAPADAWLLATGTEIALSLHRGATAEALLAGWRAHAAPEDAPRIAQAAEELAGLRATELGASSGIRRGRAVAGLGGVLALLLFFAFVRRAD